MEQHRILLYLAIGFMALGLGMLAWVSAIIASLEHPYPNVIGLLVLALTFFTLEAAILSKKKEVK